METITLQVLNIIGDEFAVEADDGERVYSLIAKAFRDDKTVCLSFQNIEMLTTAFLNAAIGQLYNDFSEIFIKENLLVSNISESGKVALKRVVETAKLYYSDPEALQRSIDEILES